MLSARQRKQRIQEWKSLFRPLTVRRLKNTCRPNDVIITFVLLLTNEQKQIDWKEGSRCR
jgi:hypothetical protein